MSNQKSTTTTYKLTAKDVIAVLGVSKNTAYKILRDIREEYETNIVTRVHFDRYLNI